MSREVRAQADVRLADARAVLCALLDHLQDEVHVTRLAAGAIIDSSYGQVTLSHADGHLRVEAASPTLQDLAVIRTYIADHVAEFGGGASLSWTGAGAGVGEPQNFQRVRLVDTLLLTENMRRLTFEADTVETLADPRHHHVRLLIPPAGSQPQWPCLVPDGRLVWPSGDATLTRRVYTIRRTDRQARTFDIDVFLHGHSSPGGQFARLARPGNMAGILGPGGSGQPEAPNLLLIGDETAWPAIARIVENAPAAARIEIIADCGDRRDQAYLAGLTGAMGSVSVTWLLRQDSSQEGRLPRDPSPLVDAVRGRIGVLQGSQMFVWAGCERSVAADLRVAIDAAGIPASRSRIVAYWSAEG